MPLHYVPCSYGELVDKWTILRIKEQHCSDTDSKKLENIKRECKLLSEMITDMDDLIIQKLYEVNSELWNLEDKIRELSNKSNHGSEFIECAENIHILNDKRYSLKRELNDKYDSDLKEEKIYAQASASVSAQAQMVSALNYFPSNVPKCYEMLKSIVDNLTGFPVSPFGVNLYLNYSTALNFLGIDDPRLPPIDWVMTLIQQGILPDTDSKYKAQIALELLRNGRYIDSYPYLPYLHIATGPYNICPDNMSYFKPDDKDKTMILYSSGGLGDIIMFSRLVPLVCKRHPECKVLFLVESRLVWLMKQAFSNIVNLEVKEFTSDLPKFEYHYNINALMEPLKITTESNLIPTHMNSIQGSGRFLEFIKELGDFVLLGWKGNENNHHEIHNRRVPLQMLLEKISRDSAGQKHALVTVQRDITKEERELLQQYNVHILSDVCQEEQHAFYDTVDLVRHAYLVISSDTALLHLAGSIRPAQWDTIEETFEKSRPNTIGLVTKGCDWRWNRINHDLWYPIVNVVRQTEFGDWSSVLC